MTSQQNDDTESVADGVSRVTIGLHRCDIRWSQSQLWSLL